MGPPSASGVFPFLTNPQPPLSGRGGNVLSIVALSSNRPAFVYEPAWTTVVAGFEAYPHRRSIDFRSAVIDEAQILARTKHLRWGDLFLWLGSEGSNQVPWLELRARRVLTIYYRTEPHDTCMHKFSQGYTETWEYTMVNTKRCSDVDTPISRYVPPGAQNVSAPLQHTQGTPPLTFVGKMGGSLSECRTNRLRCIQSIQRNIAHDKWHSVYGIWSEESYAAAVRNASIFLNVHRCCTKEDEPLESFRVAKALNYRGLVVSEKSHPADEAHFAGLVTFVTSGELAQAYGEIARLDSRARLARATAIRADFQRRFEPRRLFERAGVYQMLDNLRARQAELRRRPRG